MRIGDFGISRILMSNSEVATTFVGTPYYMSPEVLKHDGYNSKSDIWSVLFVIDCIGEGGNAIAFVCLYTLCLLTN